ncbi:MAG: 30S ribosomal protein S11 [bacterium]|nr:30S ribosomal protein S11 [bacterium]
MSAKTKTVTIEGQTEPTPVESVASAEAPKKGSSKKQVINGTATVNISYNNTIITIADSVGQVIAFSSAGLLGFKGSKKSTPYAANMVAKDCFEKTKKFNLTNIKIVIKGVGPGRESAIRGLASTGLNVLSIMDATPIAHNGVRRPKPRRV